MFFMYEAINLDNTLMYSYTRTVELVTKQI